MKLIWQTLGYGLIVVLVIGLLSFGPAGTFDYWQAWVFIAVYAIAATVPTISWGAKNPDVVRRRMHAGPTAETRIVQKLASGGLFVAFALLFVVSGLDHRFGWSTMPMPMSLVGDAVAALGLGLGILAVAQNNYAAANITVETQQPVISRGLYGLVRHPMYFSVLITMAGIPLALGSYWGLAVLTLAILALVLRIDDEEKMLTEELSGYREYTHQVRYRVIPYLW